MLFNSIQFILFFPVVVLIYYILRTKKSRNLFLLIASYYFYMNWNPIYVFLILFSTISTFCCSLFIEKNRGNKYARAVLILNLVVNLAILFVFKYYNFINESVFSLLKSFGLRWSVPNLKFLLPVGISFYTFQAIGYSIDVYRGRLGAEHNIITYALFVSFFPQLVAGPIERANNLLPQFHTKHVFDEKKVTDGLKLMLWGFFMKVCVADRLGTYVDPIYDNVENYGGCSLLIATVLFAFQIYCDFCGYSLIAIGSAKCMGFSLMDNFRRPYLSISVKEFWKRWHISLSTWFMDYVYIPLGGNRVPLLRNLFNLLVTFLISGLWHGANWTFVIWGGIHGMYLIIEKLFTKFVKTEQYETWPARILKVIWCFSSVSFAWIFFRADNIPNAVTIIHRIFMDFQLENINIGKGNMFILSLVMLAVLIVKDVLDEYLPGKLSLFSNKHRSVRWFTYYLIIAMILVMATPSQNFIYFQF